MQKLGEFLFPLWPNLSAQDVRKHSYVRLIYLIGILISVFYLLKYNFQYQVTTYNAISFLILFFVLAWPQVVRRTCNLNYLALGVFGPLCIYLTIMVYAGGGLRSPGVFWIVAVPATGSTLFGRRGVWFGSIYAMLVTIALRMLELQQLIPTDVLNMVNYDVERLTNLLTFSTYLLLTLQFFVRTEDQLIAAISSSQVETENLLRTVLHDVATPTTTICTAVEMMKMHPNDASGENDKSLDRIDRASKTISTMLDKLRTIRSVQDGKVNLNIHPLNVVAVLKSAIQINNDRSEAKKVKVLLKSESDSIMILGDETVLTLVIFTNLLTNAIKFSESQTEVHIIATKDAQTCSVQFRDFGIGMPDALLGSLFDLRTATTRRGTSGEKGTGYGMPLVKNYISKMHGEISVKSVERDSAANETAGTTVTIRLPLVNA